MIRSKKRHFVWLIAAEAVAITTPNHRALCASWMLAQLRADVIDGWPPWRGSPRLKNPLVALLKMPMPPTPTLSSRFYDIFLLFCHITGGYSTSFSGNDL
jgi:hypothetical protein